MKKSILFTAIFGLSATAGITAQADDKDGVYVNIGGTLVTASDDELGTISSDDSITLTTVTGRLGYRISENLAIEGEAGFGLGSDTLDLSLITPGGSPAEAEVKMKNYFAGFAKGILPVSEDFDLFARVGYGQADIEATVTVFLPGGAVSDTQSETGDDFLFGGGAQYNFTKNDGIRVDYTRFSDINLFSLTYARRF